MATYAELYTLAFANNGTVLQRVAVACMVQAEVVRVEAVNVENHANRLLWAQNASLTTTQINNATDANLLTAVANAVNVFATGA